MQTGKMLLEKQVHEGDIQDMQMSPDGAYFITASLDKTAKLVDAVELEALKTYKTGRFVQSAAISPLFDHEAYTYGQLSQAMCENEDLMPRCKLSMLSG
eukprot:1159102-Pelagomonas_calceolata.AAC.1